MAHPADESELNALRLDFDRRLVLHFHGSVVQRQLPLQVASPFGKASVHVCAQLDQRVYARTLARPHRRSPVAAFPAGYIDRPRAQLDYYSSSG